MSAIEIPISEVRRLATRTDLSVRIQYRDLSGRPSMDIIVEPGGATTYGFNAGEDDREWEPTRLAIDPGQEGFDPEMAIFLGCNGTWKEITQARLSRVLKEMAEDVEAAGTAGH